MGVIFITQVIGFSGVPEGKLIGRGRTGRGSIPEGGAGFGAGNPFPDAFGVSIATSDPAFTGGLFAGQARLIA